MQRPHTLTEAPPDVAMTEATPARSEQCPRCMLLIVRKDMRISFANASAKSALKVIRGDALESLRHSLSISELSDAIQRVWSNPQALASSSSSSSLSPLTVMHRDGSALLCTLEPVFEEQTLTGVAVFLAPQTTSDADAERLYSSVLDSLHHPVLAVDNHGRVLYLNQAAGSLLGVAARELRGALVHTFVSHNDDSEGLLDSVREEAVAKAVACGAEWAGPVTVRTKTGVHACVMRAAPLRSAQGAVVGSIRILELENNATRPKKRSRSETSPQHQDSTASSTSGSPVPNRQHEDMSLLQQLREQGVSALVIISPDGLVEWATDSKWFESLLNGITAKETYGTPAAAVLCGRPADPSLVERVKEALKLSQPLELLVPQAPSDTSPTRNLHISITPVYNADGALRHYFAKLRDIDLDRLASEEALANKLRLEFFNTLSHELKTPLNGIIGASTLALRALQPNSPDARGHIETVLSCAEVLSTLINNLIDYRKIEANTLEIQRVPLDVRATFSGAVAQCDALATQKAMKIAVSVDPAVPRFVSGDSLRLTQVTVNLVLNAIKYSPPGRAVRLHIATDSSNKGALECRLVASVEDHGIGIAADKIATLFAQSPEASENGAGLGLRICKKLVDRMGGTIEVKSKLGEGTTFTFSALVGCVSEQQARFLSRERITPDADFHILVVEDNLLNQKILLRILQQLGYSADVAANGRQAIEMVAQNSYDLILMDIAMPVMNGLDASRYISRNWDEAHRPVIVGVTANAVTKEFNEYLNAGMSDCVMKPVTVAKVLSILQSARESETRRRKDARRGSY